VANWQPPTQTGLLAWGTKRREVRAAESFQKAGYRPVAQHHPQWTGKSSKQQTEGRILPKRLVCKLWPCAGRKSSGLAEPPINQKKCSRKPISKDRSRWGGRAGQSRPSLQEVRRALRTAATGGRPILSREVGPRGKGQKRHQAQVGGVGHGECPQAKTRVKELSKVMLKRHHPQQSRNPQLI